MRTYDPLSRMLPVVLHQRK